MKAYLIYKAARKVYSHIAKSINTVHCHIIFWGNHVSYKNFKTNGVPFVSISNGGTCKIGKNFSMNNGAKGNPIGCFERCTFFAGNGAKLIIGDNVGISQTAIVCHTSIQIENNVKIGGGVCIYDTDFHSLDPELRKIPALDIADKINKPVVIKNNVFIGAHSIILKGVTIGENSIIGAGSVVTKSIPPNEIWAGNPARFIRHILK